MTGYAKYGRMVQSIRVQVNTTSDARALAMFPGVPAIAGTICKIRGSQIEKAWSKLYPNVNITDFIEAYAGAPLESNKAKRNRKNEAKSRFFDGLIEIAGPDGASWLESVRDYPLRYRQEHICYRDNPSKAREVFENVAKALDMIPVSPLYLPVFAQKVTGDPHYFDLTGQAGKIFLSALSEDSSALPVDETSNPEQLLETLAHHNLLRDSAANSVSCCGLVGKRGSNLCQWMIEAANDCATQNFPLREIMRWDVFQPISGDKVYVVENSGVYASLVDEHVAATGTVPALICTNGQFTLSEWLLIGKLTKSGVTIYYSGDFDPEGLLMAQRLKDRYQESIQFWRLTAKDYISANPSKILDNLSRIAQLQNISAQGLQDVQALILKNRKVAYQEGILANLLSDTLTNSTQ